jgi:hypothetical protein
MQARGRSLNKTLAAACLLSGLFAAPAHAVYLGALKRNTTAHMEFTNQNLDKLAVTVLLINRREDISRAVPYTIPAAIDGNDGIETIPVTIGERIDRVILLVDQPGGGRCVLRIDSGPAINMEGDARITFDTEP